MRLYLSSMNITLTGRDIIEAIKNCEKEELNELAIALKSIPHQPVAHVVTNEFLTHKKKTCPHCKQKFCCTSNAQIFCTPKCKRLWRKAHPHRKRRRGVAKSKQSVKLQTVSKPIPVIEKEPPIIPAKRPSRDYISLAEGIN